MWVYERGSTLAGWVTQPGDYAGEWRIRTHNGCEVVCLEANLQAYGPDSQLNFSHDDAHDSMQPVP